MKIQTDKMLHAMAGAIIAFTLHDVSMAIAIWAVVVSAISKEIYDICAENGTPDVEDAFFTMLGGVIAIFIELAKIWLL